MRRAAAVADLDWSKTTEKALAELWPVGFDGGSHYSGYRCEPCTGSAEYLELGRIISGRHLCSFFVFFDEEPSDSGCVSSLNLFVINTTVRSREDAWQLAEDILREFAGKNAVALSHL